MQEGFAVVATGIQSNGVVAIFTGWIDAHNYLHKHVGVNNGKVVEINNIQGEMEE